ncbi:MAG: M24 family metallopeptidase [Dehalococcoidales bacterium]|nr:M24 family metallopeptidase [Dehalococcoidales bacterium]
MAELSLKEKERRRSLLRKKLQKAGLSALIVYGGTQLGVPVHYLTHIWGNKQNMVVFPVDGEPVFLIPSNTGMTGESLVKQGCWLPAENIRSSANLAVDAARLIISLKLQKTRVGIDSFRFWPVFEYRTFNELCPDVQLVEAHRLFGEIRGPKSAEELAVMGEAIRISDLAHNTFLANLKPGLTEEEVADKANEVLTANDIIDRIILIHSRPEAVYPYRPGPTVIKKPNPVTFSPEFTRNAGYGAQMIRAYWWEEPEGIYKKMFGLWAEMRQMIVREFRPGVEITNAGQKIEKLVGEWGFECDKLGHAVGLSYGDAPYITAGPHERDYMEWTILTDEVYAVHPMVRCRGGKAPFTMIGDMYFIGRDATRWMTTTLPGLPEMIPH